MRRERWVEEGIGLKRDSSIGIERRGVIRGRKLRDRFVSVWGK